MVGEVEICASEVVGYLSDISNWPQPIFPDEVGCSRLEIVPYYFNSSGMVWSCNNQIVEGKVEKDSKLVRLKHRVLQSMMASSASILNEV